jgi:aminopeptidase
VFTTPDRRRVEGTVTATRPVAREGVVVDGIRLEFREGKVVTASATAGEDSLLQQLDVDEGARRLGEVALVAGSRVGATNLLFYNTLFDENATSHVAYGMAYATAVDGAGSLSPEEQLAAGINQSHVHVDFPVGGPDVEITATTRDGRRITLVEGDTWAFDGA